MGLVILHFLLYKYYLSVGPCLFSSISLVTHESSKIVGNDSDFALNRYVNTITEQDGFKPLICINLRYYTAAIGVVGYQIVASKEMQTKQ